jgi:hypothetical protein
MSAFKFKLPALRLSLRLSVREMLVRAVNVAVQRSDITICDRVMPAVELAVEASAGLPASLSEEVISSSLVEVSGGGSTLTRHRVDSSLRFESATY